MEALLAEMTRFAIEKLEANEEGYLLVIEAGRVDHAHHAGNAARALEDTIALDEAVKVAIDSAGLDETLILVTADHGHTMSFAGYPPRGSAILGIVKEGGGHDGEPVLASDGKPYTTLGYANGPGAVAAALKGEARQAVTDEEAQHVDYLQQSTVPSYGETHGGQDVPVYAGGPGAFLIGGVLEQNVLYHVLERALTIPEKDGRHTR